MSKPVTIEDIYQIFRTSGEEFDRRLKESEIRAEEARLENERRAEEARLENQRRAEKARLENEEYRAETARILAQAKLENEEYHAETARILAQAKLENEEYHAETARILAQAKLENEEYHAETARILAQAKLENEEYHAETARILAQAKLESDRTIAELKRIVNSLTTRWGRFVEELVQPAVLRLFQEKGIDIKEIYPRARVKRQGIAMEIDVLAVDDTDVVLVECKSRLSKDDVDDFLEKLTRFKIAFPHYKNYQAYGAVAGIEIDEGIDRYAYNKGLFVIKPSGDTVEIINDDNFRPRTW